MGDMTKQELIHLHSLFAMAAETAEEDFDMNVQTPEYDELGVTPTAVHKTCTDHKEAVLALASEVADAVEAEKVAQKTA